MSAGRRGSAGFALPMVLWILMVLAIAAWTNTETSRLAIQGSVARSEVAVARAAAEAGLPLALVAIDRALREGRPVPRGFACRFGAAELLIAIEDEAGKIDVNRVSPAALTAAFEALGLRQAAADRLAAGIVAHRGGGADRDASDSAGPVRGAVQSGLGILAEIVGMPGGGALDLAVAARHLTVAGARKVDPGQATPLVLGVVRALGAEGRGLAPSPRRAFTISIAATTARARYAFGAVIGIGRPVLPTARVLDRFRLASPPVPAAGDVSPDRAC